MGLLFSNSKTYRTPTPSITSLPSLAFAAQHFGHPSVTQLASVKRIAFTNSQLGPPQEPIDEILCSTVCHRILDRRKRRRAKTILLCEATR